MNSQILEIFQRKTMQFFWNENISIVKRIYKGKVEEYMFEHLVEKAEIYKENSETNLQAWFRFYFDLDSENLEILNNSIINGLD